MNLKNHFPADFPEKASRHGSSSLPGTLSSSRRIFSRSREMRSWSAGSGAGASPGTGSSPSGDVFTPKYEAAFSGKVNAVSQACLCLGGKLQKQLAGADLTFEMPVMGDFSVLFQFWDADEEFSAKILLLWDKVSLSYLHFETTFYLQGDLLEAILQKINA